MKKKTLEAVGVLEAKLNKIEGFELPGAVQLPKAAACPSMD